MFKLISAILMVVSMLVSGLSFSDVIEEIVVTAQKREQGVNDVGITVNAFTGEQLKDRGFKTAEDMAMMTPGLTVNETAATGVPLYTIRGVGYQDYSTAASSTVGLYFDGVAIPYTVMSRGLMFDVERVEVLKGPQGDLYGRNTTAGQINFVSKKPTDEYEAGLTAGIGSYGTFDLEGYTSGSLSDSVRGRVAIRTIQSSEGWQKSTTRDDELGELDTLAIRAMFDIDLSENTNMMLNLHYVDDQSENRANTAYNGTDIGLSEFATPYSPLGNYVFGANAGETPPWYSTGNNEAADWTNSYSSPQTGRTFNLRPQRDNQLFGASATISWDMGNTLLTSITGFDQFDRVESNDWDGGFYNDSSNINTTDLSTFSQEFRLSGGDDDLNWILGAYFSSDDMSEYYHYFMSDSLYGYASADWALPTPFAVAPIMELDTKYEQETDSAALFGHMEWRFSEAWRLTLGARYTSEERTWTGCTFVADDGTLAGFMNFAFGTSMGPGDCATIDDDPDSPTNILSMLIAGTPDAAFSVFSDTIKTDRLMGKVTLDYSVNDDVLVYGTVSNGFKSGGFNGANSNGTRQLQPIREEVLTAYEGGIKATLAEGRMQLNAAAFFYDYKDKQEQDAAVTFVGNISGLANVDKSEIQGAELDLQWTPADGWMVLFGLALLDTEIKEWMAVDRDLSAWPTIVLKDVSGGELAMSPDKQFNGQIGKEWSVGDGKIMDVAIDYSYTDSTTGGSQPSDATDSYHIANLRLGYGSDDGQWRVLLWGRNITDEDYYPAAYQGGNGPWIRANGMPRTWGVSLDYKFGSN